jgi:hypothetical protein
VEVVIAHHVAALEAFARVGAAVDGTGNDVAPVLWIAISALLRTRG